jgi:hypothetical protein
MAKKARAITGGAEAAGTIIIAPGARSMIRLRLSGPTTNKEGRDLAAALNAVISKFNTLFFKDDDGNEILPKITANTARPE